MKKLSLTIAIIIISILTINVYAKEGFVTENGNTYYYTNDEMQKGFITFNNKLYFFSRGNGALKTGWQEAQEGIWYQNSDGEVVKGWQTIDNKKYYFDDNGIEIRGFKTIDNKLYFFSRGNGALKTGWQEAQEGIWYQNSDGEVVKGWQTFDNKKYYFDENGIETRGFKTIDNKLYFFSRGNGALKTGWQEAKEGVWYQNSDGEVVKGWKTFDNKKYYFDENGIQTRGFKIIDNKLYFFSRGNGALKTGWQEAKEGVWYQNSDGEVVKGWQTFDDKKYYFDENGIQTRGFKTIDDKIYFFSRVNGVLKTGWQAAAEGYWYQQEDGSLVTGTQHIDARDYVFNDQGILQGFKTENGKKYYYNPDGTQAKGVQRMCGTYFMFNSITGAYERIVNQKRVIDVSVHNGTIDWDKVKESGIVDGVILRSSFGVGYTDAKFERNVKELNRVGIPYSVYHFSYAENKAEAKREADYLVSVLKSYPVKINSNLFSIYYDLEDWTINSTGENSYGISKNTYAEMITTFASTVQNATGIKVRVYASKNYIETRFPASVQGYATWVAQWNDTITYKGAYEGWQYTSKGKVPGIDGNVDMSIFYY